MRTLKVDESETEREREGLVAYDPMRLKKIEFNKK